MNRKDLVVFLAVFVIAALALAACGGPSQPATSPPTEEVAEAEHADEGEHKEPAAEEEHTEPMEEGEHAHAEAPDEYQGLTNPFAGDASAVEEGRAVFATNCAACHGESGEGDGPAAEALDPKPATLADRAMMDSMTDGYLFWRVTEGGLNPPFNSAMPAWSETLSEDQRWQVITFLRSLGDGS